MFRIWLESLESRPIVSFDFDGVLHQEMQSGTIHPLHFDHGDLAPREEYINELFQESKNNNIIIVSARCSDEEIWQFIEIHHLPVKEVYATCMRPKIPLLMKLGVIRHYDDDVESIRQQIEQYKPKNFEFIPVPVVENDYENF